MGMNRTKTKGAIAEFKISLKKALNENDNATENLFVFIDELDRCRPTYAIELLERIKHLLDIDGLVFILAMDKDQLSHSVKAVYGNDFESKGYLSRFIDIEYTLSNTSLDNFIDRLYANFGFEEFFDKRKKYSELRYDDDHLKESLKLFSKAKRYSLRTIEQLMARVNLVIHSTDANVYLYPELLVFLLVVRGSNKDLYNDYIVQNSTSERIIDHLYSIFPEDERLGERGFVCAMLEGYLIAAKHRDNEETVGNALERYQAIINDKSLSKRQHQYSSGVIEVFRESIGLRRSINLKSLVSRIELSEKFKFSNDNS